MQIETTTALYFKDMVEAAIKNQNIKTDIMVEFYLVNLLTSFVATEKITKFANEPLVLAMERALGSNMNEQRILFKEIGDTTLYVSGFFSDSLKRKIVDIDYYIDMGRIAYNSLASLTKDTRMAFHNLYSELADRFKSFVDVLVEVSERCLLTSRRDILRIYERWLTMRSKRNEELLKALGIEPIYNLDHRIIH